ncbi:MAG: hypothetical protein RIQ51_538 [Bacteroidota bacterium]
MKEQNFNNHAQMVPGFHYLTFGGIIALLGGSITLKAQDRAIRAEENLRHYVLTGKLLPASLTVGQIVALRFAPDAEFPALAEKAASNNLSGKEIKQSIQNWKADFYRV